MASLGTLGDSMGLTVMSAYAFCILQLPVTFLLMTNCAPVRLDFFASEPRFVARAVENHNNATADGPPPEPEGPAVDLSNPTMLRYTHGLSVSVAFLGVSGLCAAFSTITVYLRDRGLDDQQNRSGGTLGASSLCTEDFVSTNVELVVNPTITMWNGVFLCLVVAGHTLLAAVVGSPVSIHGLVLVALLVYVSMGGILQPKIQTDGNPSAAGHVSSMYMMWVLMYTVAMMCTAGAIPYDPSSGRFDPRRPRPRLKKSHTKKTRARRIQFVGAAVFLDCFLLIFGHTWDHAPMVHTIMNCRLLYCVAWSALNMAMCALWRPLLSTPYF